MSKNKWWLNGGRGGGRTIRLIWEAYENAKTGEEEHKSYKQRWSFIKFMGFHGLFNEAWEIAANVWNR